jgi:O-acetyl-ADP-ribose deacetylase (regulator of RNase III)
MIEYKTGNILTEDAEAITNTVNCVGVMGRGIALQFRKAFPENFKAYAAACKREEVQPGRMFIYDMGGLTNPRYIVNFPTKRHWRGKSRMEDIESGLVALAGEIRERGIHSIAIPPLGSGLGGLEWTEVRQCIERALAGMDDVRIIVFEPKGAPAAEKMVRNREVPNMTPGRAALVELMHRYLAGLLDPFVSLLEVHKLMYFMQEAGEPLRLKYKKAPYGPYAENLRHVLNAIEGHLVSGYADGGDTPDKPLQLVPGAVEDANVFLREHAETKGRFEQVTKLVEGFESPFGLELLATVHWVMKHEHATSADEAVSRIHAWNVRKLQFTPRQIGLAVDVLSRDGWITSVH